MTSPTQMTLKALREEGWTCAVVERWVQQAGKRIDAYGFIDILAIRGDEVVGEIGNSKLIRPGQIVGVQTCAGSGHAAHRTKILAEPRALLWLEAGGSILLISWSKRGDRGKRKLWTDRREWITARDFAGGVVRPVLAPVPQQEGEAGRPEGVETGEA